MKIPHKKRDFFVPLMFLIAIALSAVCFLSHFSGTSTFFSDALSTVTTPLRSATKSVYDFCSSVVVYFKDIDDLKKENERLLAQNKELYEQNTELSLLQKENESLYKFLELKKERTDFKLSTVNVISKSASGYSSFFTIDKGSFHGIEAGMPIISEDGALVGITYSVDSNSTRCKTVISYDVSVGIYNERNGETAMLSGSFETFGDKKCLIRGILEDSDMQIGDKILTSGLGETYPRDLVIGEIVGFVPDSVSHTQNAIVDITAKDPSSGGIMVVLDFRRVYE